LYISTRTVEDVDSALRKLGVDSRHALAGPEAARALGDADTPGG
jgi:DNA-binding NarL/FixJ family response regulator